MVTVVCAACTRWDWVLRLFWLWCKKVCNAWPCTRLYWSSVFSIWCNKVCNAGSVHSLELRFIFGLGARRYYAWSVHSLGFNFYICCLSCNNVCNAGSVHSLEFTLRLLALVQEGICNAWSVHSLELNVSFLHWALLHSILGRAVESVRVAGIRRMNKKLLSRRKDACL